jgi:hypothetical protein
MIKLTFLKLESLRGLSFAPRHIGDFEVTPYYTFGDETLVGRKTNGYASRWTHLRVYKRNDTDNMQLRLAWTKEQIFRTGELVIEEVSEAGHLLKTTAFKMRKIIIEKITRHPYEDEIGLRFESMS